jgi:hypothetical protein
MATVGVARPAPPYLLGFDCLTPVTRSMLLDVGTYGFRWVGRYLETLEPAERDLIFSFGIGIMPLTEATVKEPLTRTTGTVRGVQSRDRASSLGCPPGVSIAIDFEAPMAGGDVAAHIDAMTIEIRGPYGAVLYVGEPQPLPSHELFTLLPQPYWKGAGRLVDATGALAEPDCGWAAFQLSPLERAELAGKKVDVDVTQTDYRGRVMTMWWPQ